MTNRQSILIKNNFFFCKETTSERLVKHKSKMAEDPVIINEELVEEVLEKV